MGQGKKNTTNDMFLNFAKEMHRSLKNLDFGAE